MSYENMHEFVEYIRAIQIKDDNDVFIGSTGRKGSGKSSFSIQIARNYVKKYFGENTFDLKKYIAYNNDDVIEKIHTLPKYSPLIGDEAVRFVWSRDWNKAENKELARLATQIRTKKLIFFMNIPKLAWIDSVYREGMLDIWVWIHASFDEHGKECHAMIFEPDDNQGQTDSWHTDILKKKAKKRKNRIGRFTPIDKVYKIIKMHPCFVDTFKYPVLPFELYERYLKIRNERVFERTKDFVNQRDTSKIMVYNIKQRWKELTEAVQKGRFDTPSYKMIMKILLQDPRTKQFIVKDTSINTWYKEVKDGIPLPEQQQQAEERQEGVEIRRELRKEGQTEQTKEEPIIPKVDTDAVEQ